ncbi:MAG: protein kinase [Planctomycetota bacterium]|nr:protein kinase [Planctomycetota bacterium]
MPSSFAPNEQTVISKRAPLPAPSETLHGSRPAQIGKSLEGQQLGQFLLEEFVGGGGMGAVFRAVDTTLDRIVAVKVVSNEQTDEDTLRRFRNEAQSAARLDHPNIARVYSVGEEAGWNYIVFEFIEGVNVRDLVAHKGPLPLDETISYIVQVADALEHASQRDIVHRDIKPSNLLVMQDGRAKLVDMGLARLHQVGSAAEDLTATGVTLGTFDYISPEQAKDPRDTDVRSDLYSLGCTFYYMLTGMPPFPEGTVLQKLLSHSSEAPPDPRYLRADLPEEVSAIAMKLMAKLPSQRYQRPSELTVELMKLCEKLGFVAPTTRAVLLPAPVSVAGKISRHLPWLVPVCLLFAIVFGVDALLPKPATVIHSEMIPDDLPERPADVGDQSAQPQPPSAPSGPSKLPSTDAGQQSIRPGTAPPAVESPPPAERSPDSGVTAATSRDEPKVTARTGSNSPPSPEASAIMEATSAEATLEIATGSTATLAIGTGRPVDSQLVEAPTSDAPVSPGEAKVATDRLIVIPEGPPTPDPMVVSSLEAALRRLADHPDIRVIELHCNRYEAKPLTIDLRNDLTIEAGKGFSPQLVFDRRESSAQDEKRMLHLLGGRLTLRGIHFRVSLPYSSETGWALFHLNQVQELMLERCTLTVQNDYRAGAAFFHIQSPRLPEMPVPGSDLPVPLRPNLVLNACIARGEATFVRATEGMPFDLKFTQGLVATTERMLELGQSSEVVPQERATVILRYVTAEMGAGLCRATKRDADARLPQLSVDAENCLLDHNPSVPLIEHIGMRDVAGTMSHALKLKGQLNAYPRTNTLWRIEPRDGESVVVTWDARSDSRNTWYEEKLSERYAPWLDSMRRPERIMHQVTPADYLVVDNEELGCNPALLPELPSDTEMDSVLD